jgi:hypothetical protein
VAGVIAFVDSAGKTLAELHLDGQTHPAVAHDWWVSGSADGVLGLAAFFLLMGGFIGGASVAGAEWRAGTIATVLTWEPRRFRLHMARTLACGMLAFLIATALQLVFLVALVPAVVANGSSEGLDASWWVALLAAAVRTSLLTSIAAMLGVALATLGRNTAFALVVVFAWVAVVENVLRGLQPDLARFLWGENLSVVLVWGGFEDEVFRRGPLLALSSVALYLVVFVAASAVAFRRGDVAGGG